MNINFVRQSLVVVALVSGFSLVSAAKAVASVEDGGKIYEAKCSKCHGKTGEGDGKSAKKLDTKPTKFSDAATFTDKKKTPELTPDARLALAIKKGGEAVKQSKEMDAFADLTDAQIADVVAYLKTLVKK